MAVGSLMVQLWEKNYNKSFLGKHLEIIFKISKLKNKNFTKVPNGRALEKRSSYSSYI